MACCRLGHRSRAQPADTAPSVAFERLYVAHERELYDYLARRLDAPTAEGAVAEVLARAWQQFGTRDRELDVRTWLLGLAVAHLGKHRVAELAHLKRLSVSHQGHDVARALAELDPIDRDMLTLHVWAGVEHGSVAAMTGLSPAVTRHRIDQAYAFVERRSGGA